MRSTEPLRLTAVALLILFLQLALYLKFPAWRAGIDFYVIFLLLLTTARGTLLAGMFAVVGGLMMDSFSGAFITFHVFYYLLPVFAGTLIRSHMLVEYRLLGTLTIAVLLLLKILAQFGVALTLSWIDSPAHLFRVNYWPLLLIMLGVYASWGWLVRLCGSTPPVRGLHG